MGRDRERVRLRRRAFRGLVANRHEVQGAVVNPHQGHAGLEQLRHIPTVKPELKSVT